MTINDHIALLQEVHRNITGIRWAPDETPDDIKDTPAVIVRASPMAAEVNSAGNSCLVTMQSYTVVLLAGPAGLSTFGDKSHTAYDLADKMLTAYHRTSVNGFDGVTGDFPRLVADEDNSIQHGGLVAYVFSAENVFTAIEYTLRIEDQRAWPG